MRPIGLFRFGATTATATASGVAVTAAGTSSSSSSAVSPADLKAQTDLQKLKKKLSEDLGVVPLTNNAGATIKSASPVLDFNA